MTIARHRQICLEETPYYHCVSRCVRRAFLCGFDPLTGNSYEHRRGWVEQRLLEQSQAFCIDLVGYAVMSNHYHVIVRVDVELAASLSDEEVLTRWQKLYSLKPHVSRFLQGEVQEEGELEQVRMELGKMRRELANISRFMGYLNERIAREANAEDDCKGRFWEGRFKCQALLDEEALLQCMAYVDLNPVRAGISTTPEQSAYTSVRRRLQQQRATPGLLPFQSRGAREEDGGVSTLPCSFEDYLEVLDWTGRLLRDDKQGVIPSSMPPLLDRLGMSAGRWRQAMRPPKHWTQKALGSVSCIKKYCEAIGQSWLWQMPVQSGSP